MKKIIDELINSSLSGVDVYRYKNATWLIFTESKQWVIELTESKTLWYNYNFFNGMFSYVSMDVVENEHYITKWVEDNIIGVRDISPMTQYTDWQVEEIIQNGVKETNHVDIMGFFNNKMDDALENGVKSTSWISVEREGLVNTTINNGVKEIYNYKGFRPRNIGDIIENGVKETQPLPDQSGELIGYGNYYNLKEDRTKPFIDYLEETINFGVKN